jgi:antibiotic biosynthesis monooxygenase (ABM) superfamily enzyme
MPSSTVFMKIKSNVAPELDAEFNRWYNEEHCPQHLEFRGTVSARRYSFIESPDRFKYLAVYEYENQAALQRWLESERRKELIVDHRTRFGSIDSSREIVVPIWP